MDFTATEYIGWEHCEGEPLSAEIEKIEEYRVQIFTTIKWVESGLDPNIEEDDILDTLEYRTHFVVCEGCGVHLTLDEVRENVKQDMLVRINTADPFGGANG